MKSYLIGLSLLLLGLVAGVTANDSVKVEALFQDKALVVINGQRHLMKRGDTAGGVTLLSATGRGAQIRFSNGDEQSFSLNQSISHAFKKTEKPTLKIYANSNGMFELDGSINGRPTDFLLDTGATYIALSSNEADRLGIAYQNSAQSLIQTASDVVPAWQVKLAQVKVGGIVVSNVDAVVLRGSSPTRALLGMSFLQHLKMQRNGAAMILEQKF